MAQKKQLNVRIGLDLYNQITESDKPKVEIVTEALQDYFKKKLSKVSTNDSTDDSPKLSNAIKDIDDLKVILSNKDNIIRIKDEHIKDLQTQNGFLISEFRRVMGINEKLLLPAPNKKWWKFW